MKADLKDILNQMGFKRVLQPYESFPWSYHNTDKGIDFIAEVALDGNGLVFGAEIQMVRQNPEETETPVELIFWFRATQEKDELFRVTGLRINGKHVENKYMEWGEKGCKFFKKCIGHIKAGDVPDFKKLAKNIFKDDDKAGSRGGGSGSRKNKMKNQMGIKRGV